jgi:signal transduction histidine kinase
MHLAKTATTVAIARPNCTCVAPRRADGVGARSIAVVMPPACNARDGAHSAYSEMPMTSRPRRRARDRDRAAARRATPAVTEVRTSRARIVTAANAERRRIERDLHDGAQQRLVAIGKGSGLTELSDRISALSATLRIERWSRCALAPAGRR